MNIVQVLESFIFFYCVFPRDEFHLCHSFGEQVQWFIIKHAIRETLVLWEKKKKKKHFWNWLQLPAWTGKESILFSVKDIVIWILLLVAAGRLFIGEEYLF